MNRLISGISLVALACGGCASDVQDRQPVATAGQLAIYDALAPASPAPDIASLYFTVVNSGTTADTLIRIDARLGTAQLHDVVIEGGRSMMRHVMALEIPPLDTVRLAPGGYHVMLTDLTDPLEVGDTLRVTLTFSRGGALTLAAPVLTYTDVLERLDAGVPNDP